MLLPSATQAEYMRRAAPAVAHVHVVLPLPPRIVHRCVSFPVQCQPIMAHPSPSPSGSGSRRLRLSEVLREQQEPFSLDLYLLEKGCSPAFLDAATACGGGACSTCWPPRTRSAGRTPRRPARRKKGSRRSRGVLRLLLSKILSAKTTTAAAPAATRNWKRQQPAAIDWRRVVEEERRTPDRSSEHGFASPRRVVDDISERVEEEEEDAVQEEEDEDEDEAPKKQLSPVSVLEQRLFEHSPPPPPPPPHAQKALAIFSELLEAAYTPAASLLEDLLAVAHAKDEYRSRRPGDSATACEEEERPQPWPPPPCTPGGEEEGLGRVSAALQVASEMGGAARAGAGAAEEELWAWAQDVAAAVLDALTEETASELMRRHDDNGGGDGPRLGG
ncbi:hypothetical protein U9M48_036537 [Paspalum notatum var. saurae]|uniref:DUF4378 domain-containing protein n=1 Tax=Paspalum notatum var. saurae TaxID=547442 RepID=A0AAQ3UHD8_PASNO